MKYKSINTKEKAMNKLNNKEIIVETVKKDETAMVKRLSAYAAGLVKLTK